MSQIIAQEEAPYLSITYAIGKKLNILLKGIHGEPRWVNHQDINNKFTIKWDGDRWVLKQVSQYDTYQVDRETSVKLNTDVSGKLYFHCN